MTRLPAAEKLNTRTDGVLGLPAEPVCVYCLRRATHCWGPGTGRDDHTCCIHRMLTSGDEPTAGHDECALAYAVVLGELPLAVLNDRLAARAA